MSKTRIFALTAVLAYGASTLAAGPVHRPVRSVGHCAATRSARIDGEVTGRVVFDGTSHEPPGDLTRIIVFTWDTDQETLWRQIEVFRSPNIFPQAAMSTDGTFRLSGLVPGISYTVEIGRVPRGWWLRSAVIDGQDILDLPLRVTADRPKRSGLVLTLTDRRATLVGVARTAAHSAAPSLIVVFPASQAMWRAPWRRVRTVPTDADGNYTLAGLNAGEYFAAAVPPGSATGRSVRDATYLGTLQRQAVTVTLGEGEQKTQDLLIATITK